LLQLAQALTPLTEQEVLWVLRQGRQRKQQQQQQQQQDNQAGAKVLNQQQQAGSQRQAAAPQQQQEQDSFSIWDWDRQLHCAQAPVLQQLQDPALKQHMHLDAVLQGFSGLLQRLLGVQLLLRPAGQAETWGQHVRVVLVVKQQRQQQQVLHGPGAGAGWANDDCCVEVLGTVYLDVGGGYGTRMLRYTRAEEELTSNGSSSSSSSSSVRGAEPGVAEMPAFEEGGLLRWEQLSGSTQQQLLRQSSGAVAVAIGITGSRVTLQKHGRQQQQQQQQRMLQEQPSNDDSCDVADPSSSSGSSSGALVLSVGQLWEFGHEMGHALHLVLSSR
jgi:hypothetical protein